MKTLLLNVEEDLEHYPDEHVLDDVYWLNDSVVLPDDHCHSRVQKVLAMAFEYPLTKVLDYPNDRECVEQIHCLVLDKHRRSSDHHASKHPKSKLKVHLIENEIDEEFEFHNSLLHDAVLQWVQVHRKKIVHHHSSITNDVIWDGDEDDDYDGEHDAYGWVVTVLVTMIEEINHIGLMFDTIHH